MSIERSKFKALTEDELDGLIAASAPTAISWVGDYSGYRLNVRRWMVHSMALEIKSRRAITDTKSPEGQLVDTEALAEFLCNEFDGDFLPNPKAHWPEDANDDGKIGRAHV